jgi:DNA-binding winged helix-turn-helix (wHTH) protein/tetratricopeptide (TPR) repeat protein
VIYYFGDIALDADRRELRRGGVLRTIEPQVFDLLLFLIENRDRVVSRDEIFRKVWRNRIVSDSVLSTRINAVRNAIGDSGAEQRLIRTLHGRGFRFVRALRESLELPPLTEANRGAGDLGNAGKVPDQTAIAILQFGFDQPDCRRFCDELVESIMVGLSRVPWLHVVSNLALAKQQRMDSWRLARSSGAAYALQGRVRLLAGRLHVFVELADSGTGRQIWAERYDRELGASGHHTLVQRVVTALKKHLSRAAILNAWRKQTGSLAVWDCIIRAIALINTRRKPDWKLAVNLLLEAVKKDPASVQAHALLSYVTTVGVAAGWTPRQAALALSFDAGFRAWSLNGDDPWAQLAIGFARAWNRQPEDGVLHYKKAIEIDPQFSYAQTLLGAALCYLGDHRQALAETLAGRQFMDADLFAQGNAGVNNNTIAVSHFVAGNYRRGLEFGQRALVESPELPTIHRFLLVNHVLSSDVHRARNVARRLKQLVPSTSAKAIAEWSPFVRSDERTRIVEACRLAGLN